MQPKCVQMPTRMIQFSWPSLVRLASVACSSTGKSSLRAKASGRFLTSTFTADSISAFVRLRMKIGLPRHIAVIACPSLTGDKSISTEESAIVLASGFICWMNGHRSEAAPTAANALPATTMKSLRFGSKASVVTAASGLKRLGATVKSYAGWSEPLLPQSGRPTQDPVNFFYPRRRSDSVWSGPQGRPRPNTGGNLAHRENWTAAHCAMTVRDHAFSALPARYRPKHRDDPSLVRVPRRSGRCHRSDRLRHERPNVETGGARLSRPRRSDAPRELRHVHGAAQHGQAFWRTAHPSDDARQHRPLRLSIQQGRHLDAWARKRRLSRRGARLCRCTHCHSDAAGTSLSQRRPCRRDGARRSAASDRRLSTIAPCYSACRKRDMRIRHLSGIVL